MALLDGFRKLFGKKNKEVREEISSQSPQVSHEEIEKDINDMMKTDESILEMPTDDPDILAKQIQAIKDAAKKESKYNINPDKEKTEQRAEVISSDKEEVGQSVETMQPDKKEVEQKAEIEQLDKDEAQQDSEIINSDKDEVEQDSETINPDKDEVEQLEETTNLNKGRVEQNSETINSDKDEVEQDVETKNPDKNEVEQNAKTKQLDKDEVQQTATIVSPDKNEKEQTSKTSSLDRAMSEETIPNFGNQGSLPAKKEIVQTDLGIEIEVPKVDSNIIIKKAATIEDFEPTVPELADDVLLQSDVENWDEVENKVDNNDEDELKEYELEDDQPKENVAHKSNKKANIKSKLYKIFRIDGHDDKKDSTEENSNLYTKSEKELEQSDDENSTPEFYAEPDIEPESESEIEIEYKDLTDVNGSIDIEKNDKDYEDYDEIEKQEDEQDQNPVVYFEGELVDSNFLTEEENLEEQANRELSIGIFKKLWQGLTKTRENILSGVENVLKSFKKIDDELYEELEEVLIMADFGLETTDMILNELREVVKVSKITDPVDLKEALKDIITNILSSTDQTKAFIEDGKQNVILIVGVNGAGKTTSVAKLAHLFKEESKTVLLAAADTFRAAAIEQLGIWADRAGVDMIKNKEGTDPASVVYDAISAARARKVDILICDTAGRLQNKVNLMKELEKIGRIIDKEYSNAHKQVILVLDATTGQNAISQVKLFNEVVKIDGIILTKLDGTAKGGAIVGICQTLNVPVKFIGVGEKMDDLQKFNPEEFAKALFSSEE